jgi:hypothetical protein
MAKQQSIIIFTGRLGSMIGYHRNGKHFLRSMPDTVRQTAATQRAARRFGMASKTAALIRSAFNTALDVRCDSSHINRLTKQLIPSAGAKPQAVKGFRFNLSTGTDSFFGQPPTCSDAGILHIPPQRLPLLKGLQALEVKVIAVRINCATHEIVGRVTETITVNSKEAFPGATFPVEISGEGTLFVTLQVRGISAAGISANSKYLAADIIAVQEPQIEQVCHKPVHTQQALIRHHQEPDAAHTYASRHPAMVQRE